MNAQPLLLASLIQADGFISGRLLAQRLGINLSSCIDEINKLRQFGLEIESSDESYRLLNWTETLEFTRLQRFLSFSSESILKKFRIQLDAEIDSTNEEAKRHAKSGDNASSIFLAKKQTAGRGRLGRVWESTADEGLYLTILLNTDRTATELMPVTMLIALAIQEALQLILPEATSLKWPNDIVYQDRKLCGILIESLMEASEIRQLIIGIGLNINQAEFADELTQKAISLKQITGLSYDPNYIASLIVDRFLSYYQRFVQADYHFTAFIDQYRRVSATLGRQVRVLRGERYHEGRAIDIDEDGAIYIEFSDGCVESFASGEVQLRGLYGYL